MNADGVFFVEGDQLKPLIATPYENEDLLQKLLVDFPELLAGTVTDEEDRRPLLLVKRERGIPIAKGASNHFSIDHFFVDSLGVPVLVEVKRQSDTRIRREVVGQMLDYAANAVRYWPIAEIRSDFEALHMKGDPEAEIADFSDVGGVEAFWSAVDRNLRDGRIRMLFVADGFPDELVRVIEFLNEQMTPAEVLGIEVRQYTDGSRHVLVPRVIGATSLAERTKRSAVGTTPWNRTTMIDACNPGVGSDSSLLEILIDHAEATAAKLSWGRGQSARLSVWRDVAGNPRPVWYLRIGADGEPAVGIWRGDLTSNPGLEICQPLFDAVASLAGFSATFETHASFPEATLAELGDSGVTNLMTIVDQFCSSSIE